MQVSWFRTEDIYPTLLSKYVTKKVIGHRQINEGRAKKRKRCSDVNKKSNLFQPILHSYNMPEMVGYDPQTLKKVYFQEFSQLDSDSQGSLYKKMA